ncbi:16837_t:CDS:2, partial [Cetraspora pellucida]
MPPKGRKQKPELQRNEVDSALNALRSGPSASIIKPRNASKPTTQPLNIDINNIDNNTQNSPCEIDLASDALRSGLSTSIIKKPRNATSTKENETMKLILEITKQVLMQNMSIIEKQDALESVFNVRGHDNEWWQKGAIKGIKKAIDNWLYPNNKIYEQAIRKELEMLPTVNLESSESEIITWKASEEVQWCLENLDSTVEEEDKTYLQMVAKK